MSVVVGMTEEDIYGQRHPIECPELIAVKLKELNVELDNLPASDKQGWEQAKTKCPDLVNEDTYKLMFLRAEVYNADVSDAFVVRLRAAGAALSSLLTCNLVIARGTPYGKVLG